MENRHLHDDQLFRQLNERLGDYEAPYEAADWDAMNRSLDQLPKSNRFRWKFSLNNILIVLGITGLSITGYLVGKSSAGVEQQAPIPAAEAALHTTSSAPAMTVNAPATTTDNNVLNETETVAATTPSVVNTSKKQSPESRSDLRFGDQIDPLKGFVKPTHEDPTVISKVDSGKKIEVYYDIENGKVTPIVVPQKDNTTDDVTPKDAPVGPASEGRAAFGDDGQ